MTRKSLPLATLLAAAAVAGAAACSASHSSQSASSVDAGADAPTSQPFQADPPAVYVAKVKNLLVGQPPTDAEVKQVQSDPTQLGSLIAGWQQQPEYATKMLRFFQLAFQQTQITAADFADQSYPRQLVANNTAQALILQNLQESFARTMLALTQPPQNQPLTVGITTHQIMLTTALKELYSFLDVWEVDDDSKVTDHWKQANPNVSITMEGTQPIPIAETLDPNSPNYMHWYDPDVGTTADSMIQGCNTDPIVYSGKTVQAQVLHYALYGTLVAWTGTGGVKCGQYGGSSKSLQLTSSDFSDWTLVTVRPPNAGEATSTFYDLPTLRTATELVLTIPRVGFFSTPAFFANWQTNTSNTMRVTVNQTLIVSTGSSIDGTDQTTPPSTPGLDSTHANQAACYSCHRLLDPTRSILAASWSWNYHGQTDSTYTGQPGLFAFRGVINQNIKTLDDFAGALATHPYFAPGWVQKLCYYANSSPCDATDPAFTQIVSDFAQSKYDWNGLVKELLSSPIVTNASPTATSAQNGEVVAVSRRDHLCAAINARLGFADVCGLGAATTKQYAQTAVPQIAAGLPSDAYGRGATAPVLPNQPTLFFRAGTENICEALAAETIDVPTGKQQSGVQQWTSAQATAAIDDFVAVIMGLVPSDPRYAQAQTLLNDHFQQASKQSGITPTQALQSTFVAACLAPSAVSIGM